MLIWNQTILKIYNSVQTKKELSNLNFSTTTNFIKLQIKLSDNRYHFIQPFSIKKVTIQECHFLYFIFRPLSAKINFCFSTRSIHFSGSPY